MYQWMINLEKNSFLGRSSVNVQYNNLNNINENINNNNNDSNDNNNDKNNDSNSNMNDINNMITSFLTQKTLVPRSRSSKLLLSYMVWFLRFVLFCVVLFLQPISVLLQTDIIS